VYSSLSSLLSGGLGVNSRTYVLSKIKRCGPT
jgi:hypothetical protein